MSKSNYFLDKLEQRASIYDYDEDVMGTDAFDRKYIHKFKRNKSSSFIDDKSRVSSEKRCKRENARANKSLRRIAQRTDRDNNDIMKTKSGDSIIRRKAIATLNSYVKDNNSKYRRSKRSTKKRRIDNSTGYSFQSSSENEDNNDNDDDDDDDDGNISFQGDNDVDEEDVGEEDDYKVDGDDDADNEDNVGDDDDDVEYDIDNGDDDEEEEDVINDEEDICVSDDSESGDDVIALKTKRRQLILSDSSGSGNESECEFGGSGMTQSSNSHGNCAYSQEPNRPIYSSQEPLISSGNQQYQPQYLHQPQPQPQPMYHFYQSGIHQPHLPVSNHIFYHHYHHHHQQQQQMPPPMMQQRPGMSSSDEKWNQSFRLIYHHKVICSHALRQEIIGFKLHDWLSQQRRLKRDCRLPQWKVELFESIGM